MSDVVHVSVGEKQFGGFYLRVDRDLEISDDKLTLKTKLDGTWPGSWDKKAITVDRNHLY